ncbi:Uncharacterised protein [Bacillus freudenreichii]|nr:Uncharacterised protein [Bacillus freudenreichii]
MINQIGGKIGGDCGVIPPPKIGAAYSTQATPAVRISFFMVHHLSAIFL